MTAQNCVQMTHALLVQQAPEPQAPPPEPLSPEDERYLRHYKRLRDIITGELPIQLHLDFMYSHNHADLQILKNMKAAVEVIPAVAAPAQTTCRARMRLQQLVMQWCGVLWCMSLLCFGSCWQLQRRR